MGLEVSAISGQRSAISFFSPTSCLRAFVPLSPIRPDSIGICGLFPLHGDPDLRKASGPASPEKKGRCASSAKREDIRAPRFPSPAWLIPHGSSLMAHPFVPPLRSLCLCVESLPCARVRGAESFTSAQNSQKKSRLASRQTAFGGRICQMHLPGARRGGRGSLYRRSCSCVFTSSMSTTQISGGAASVARAN